MSLLSGLPVKGGGIVKGSSEQGAIYSHFGPQGIQLGGITVGGHHC